MKRIAALLLAVSTLIFAACGDKKTADSGASPDGALHAATSDSTTDQATPDQRKPNSASKVDDASQSGHKAEKKINKKFFATPLKNRSAQIDTEELLQNPELPTGCESVALTSALRSLGFEIEKTDFADKYLIYGEDVMWSYVGDPEEMDGAGIYPPGLTNSANDYLAAKKSKYSAYNTMGIEFTNLFKLIEKGYPVLIWTTMDYEEPVLGDVAFDYNGKYYYWYELEHCVMLCGYDLDEGTVTINDPLEGIVTLDLEQMKEVYNGIDKLSMTIMEDTENTQSTTALPKTNPSSSTSPTKQTDPTKQTTPAKQTTTTKQTNPTNQTQTQNQTQNSGRAD